MDITNTTPEVLIAQIEHTRAQNLKGIVVWYYAGLVKKDALKRLKEAEFSQPAALLWR